MIAHVIHDDTGLPDEAAKLLAVSLVGMAQVSARFWLTDAGGISRPDAVALVSGLAWRGHPRLPAHRRALTDRTPPAGRQRPTHEPEESRWRSRSACSTHPAS